MYVVPFPVVRDRKSLHMMPRARYRVCVGACMIVNEANDMVNGAVHVTFRVEIPVRYPAITDGRNARFDPSNWAVPIGHLKCRCHAEALLSGLGVLFVPSLGCRPVIGCRRRAKGTRGGYAGKRLGNQYWPRTEQKRTRSGKQLWGVKEGLLPLHGNEGAASAE